MRASEFIVEVASTVTPDRIEDLKKLYDSGVSNEEIAKLLDIHSATVKKWLNTFYKDRVKRQTTSNIDVDIDKLKQLVDQGKTYREIASIMGYDPDVMLKLIKNRYKDRTRKFTPVKMTPERLKDIKDAYDLGYKIREIGELFDTSPAQIGNILTKYYPDRAQRVVHTAKAATSEDIEKAIALWKNGEGIKNIGDAVGVDATTVTRWLIDKFGSDEVEKEQTRRRSTGGSLHISRKVTPEMRDKIRELYVTGMKLDDIAIAIGSVIAPRNVESAMTREPDYAELRAKRDERKQQIKKANVATTKIYRPGTIGNLRSKGPQSRHTQGVNWPKYGE